MILSNSTVQITIITMITFVRDVKIIIMNVFTCTIMIHADLTMIIVITIITSISMIQMIMFMIHVLPLIITKQPSSLKYCLIAIVTIIIFTHNIGIIIMPIVIFTIMAHVDLTLIMIEVFINYNHNYNYIHKYNSFCNVYDSRVYH